MTDIALTFDPRTLDRVRIEKLLSARVRKKTVARWARPTAVAGFLALSLGLSVLTRDARITILWLFPCLAFFAIHDILQSAGRRQYLAASDSAPIRQRRSTTIVLTPSGVTMDGTHFSWAEIIEVLHLRDTTLLMLLPNGGISIPDSALPPDITPQTLAARIAEWKTK